MEFQKGDIVVMYRHKYKGPFNYLLTRLICFFTTEWWRGEKTSTTYHAEMIYEPNEDINLVKDISQEWPCVRITDLGHLHRKAIFRLKNKPLNFETLFNRYCNRLVGQPYDWLKLMSMALFWLFWGSSFSRWLVRLFSLKKHDVCSEFVARFYEDEIGVPCSRVDANYTAPDDILDYCLDNPDLFEVIVNNED
jgi:hypothetical protein